MNELAETLYERHAVEALSEHLQSLHSSVEQVDQLIRNQPQLQQLAETVRSLRSKQVFAEGVGAKQLQQLPEKLRRIGIGLSTTAQQIKTQLNPAIQKPIDQLNFEQKPLTNQKTQALEQQRLVYRQKYQDFQKRVRSYPGFSDSPNWEVDVGVALLVVKESSDHNEVGLVLTQSDQLKEWKASLSENEYMVKGKAYIHQVFEQAQHLREARSLDQQQQQKRDLGLEL